MPSRAADHRTDGGTRARAQYGFRSTVVLAFAAAMALLPGTDVRAHPLAPSLLIVREAENGRVDVTWKTPLMQAPGAELRPVLPHACTPLGTPTMESTSESVTTTWTEDCGAGGLVGRTFAVEGLEAGKTDALLRLELADGRKIDTVLRPRAPAFTLPARDGWFDVVGRYALLGIEHILTGWDHLLFVFGLLLLATGGRALVATVTAFTLGHSVTLACAVLDLAHVPTGPVEVLIAGSIFVLAVELAGPDSPGRPFRRRPWLLAFTFGLLHGLGFAGTLRDTGLPADGIAPALFGFNVGIEAGQLAFVIAMAALAAALRPIGRRLPRWVQAAPVYAMGTIAFFWMLERARPLWP